MEFRKKPVIISAKQYTYPATPELRSWMGRFAGPEQKNRHPSALGEMVVHTLEDGQGMQGKHIATEGDWIVRGVKGEFYPCKPDIFELTYDRVEE